MPSEWDNITDRYDEYHARYPDMYLKYESIPIDASRIGVVRKQDTKNVYEQITKQMTNVINETVMKGNISIIVQSLATGKAHISVQTDESDVSM